MQNELKREREIAENFNKSSEAIKHFEQFLKSPRSNNDTSRLGFSSTKVGETSKSAEQKMTKVRIQNPLVITIIRKGILLMFVGVKGPINRIHLKVKGIIISATYKDI